MKKTIFTLLVMISVAHLSNAQDDTRGKFRVGIKVGTNYSNVYDSQGDSFDASGKFGLATGIFLSIPIVKTIGFQPEILLSQKGFKGKGVLLGSSYDLTRTTTYIDIPLMLAIKPVSFLTLLAGPQLSYLIRQRDVFAGQGASIIQEKEFANDNLRKNTVGAVVGGDINIVNVVIGLRAGFDFQNNVGSGSPTTPRYKNTWVQATLGYRF